METTSTRWSDNQAEQLSASADMSISVKSVEPVTGGDDIVRRWQFGNQVNTNNLAEVRVEFPFDPTRATVPIPSSTIKVENGVNYGDGLPPVAHYDFISEANKRALGFPTTITADLGFLYPDSVYERLASFHHNLVDVVTDDYDMYATFTAEAFLSQLDKGIFYKGRYDANGIDGVTLLTEILEDVQFRGEGGWNYILGSETCVTSTTVPLWRDTGFEYWVIDQTLDRFTVHIPIPAVSHRQALQMVASYLGADIWINRHGQIVISRGLYAGVAPDYTLDIKRIYDRPKRTRATTIGVMEGKLNQYIYEATTSEIVKVDIAVPAVDSNETKAYRITHDGCHDGSLVLTGATLVGTPAYYTYSTEFTASSTNASFTATLTGKKVEIKNRTLTVPFVAGGVMATYNNPIASDETYLHAAMHEYVRMVATPTYEITMRDDPAIDNGDRLMLEQSTAREYAVAGSEGPTAGVTTTPVIVGNIVRTFSGALDATYLLYENTNIYTEDFSSLDDTDSISGYDGWVVVGTAAKTTVSTEPMVSISSGGSAARSVDLRSGSVLRFSLLANTA